MSSIAYYVPNMYFYMFAKQGGTMTIPSIFGGNIQTPAYQPISGPLSLQQIKEYKAYTEKRYKGIHDDPDIKIIKVFAQCQEIVSLDTEPTY